MAHFTPHISQDINLFALCMKLSTMRSKGEKLVMAGFQLLCAHGHNWQPSFTPIQQFGFNILHPTKHTVCSPLAIHFPTTEGT
jgi:hypothetical protein